MDLIDVLCGSDFNKYKIRETVTSINAVRCSYTYTSSRAPSKTYPTYEVLKVLDLAYLLLITEFLHGSLLDASVIRIVRMKSLDKEICEWSTSMQTLTQGRRAAGLQPHLNWYLKKYCVDVKSFTWFTLQPKLATKIFWWLVHRYFEKLNVRVGEV
jgi:hypothetical protein